MDNEHWYMVLWGIGILAGVLGMAWVFALFIYKIKTQQNNRRQSDISGFVGEEDVKKMLRAWCAACTFVELFKGDIMFLKNEVVALRSTFNQRDADRVKDKADLTAERLQDKAEVVAEKKEVAERTAVAKHEQEEESMAVAEMISKIAQNVALLAFSVKDRKKKEAILNDMVALQRRGK